MGCIRTCGTSRRTNKIRKSISALIRMHSISDGFIECNQLDFPNSKCVQLIVYSKFIPTIKIETKKIKIKSLYGEYVMRTIHCTHSYVGSASAKRKLQFTNFCLIIMQKYLAENVCMECRKRATARQFHLSAPPVSWPNKFDVKWICQAALILIWLHT